jgi:diaminopimelate epimerase
MPLPYTKMSGAGNTFIVIEERCLPEGTDPGPLAPSLCAAEREHGGADGLIVVGTAEGVGLQDIESDAAEYAGAESRRAVPVGAGPDRVDFAMKYFNRDGSTGMMCGNGGRCAVRFAADHGYVRDTADISFTNAGVEYRAELTERGAKVWFPDPRAFAFGLEVDLAGSLRRCHFADVGTPHAIMYVDEAGEPSIAHVADIDVPTWGAALRGHRRFAPDGANANFVEVRNDGIDLRTFERGVEAETGACGTGAISAALVTAMLRHVDPPIDVRTTSGEILRVDFRLDGDHATDVSLEGSADIVMQGEIGLAW